jgi:hypothetical protein
VTWARQAQRAPRADGQRTRGKAGAPRPGPGPDRPAGTPWRAGSGWWQASAQAAPARRPGNTRRHRRQGWRLYRRLGGTGSGHRRPAPRAAPAAPAAAAQPVGVPGGGREAVRAASAPLAAGGGGGTSARPRGSYGWAATARPAARAAPRCRHDRRPVRHRRLHRATGGPGGTGAQAGARLRWPRRTGTARRRRRA